MPAVALRHETDFDGWRDAVRLLLGQGVPPEQVTWSVGDAADLLDAAPPAGPPATFTVPRALIALAQTVIQAREPRRFALLYRLVWRLVRGERFLMEQVTDLDLHHAARLAQSVRRDTHKMRAFLRFREVTDADGATRHVGWFEPAHYIVEANAGFFVRRFAGMTWSILTPYRSAHWDGQALHFAAGATRAEVPDDDALAEYWQTYYASIFNPARLKVAAMTAEMPKKYWRNLPEAAAIPDLIRAAPRRAAEMVEQPVLSPPRPPPRAMRRASPEAAAPAPDTLPPDAPPLARAAAEAAGCRACPLWEPATQTVFGEGPEDARLMLVGEQPGDQEDIQGRPFVGPAGQMLDRALAEAGIDRAAVYVTNAVKHFKFTPRGKRRIHQSPDAGEIAACRFWLELERRAVAPPMTVLMGASAARAVLGRAVTIGRERGTPMRLPDGGTALVTVHPSYLLRLPEAADQAREYRAFVADLRKALALVPRS